MALPYRDPFVSLYLDEPEAGFVPILEEVPEEVIEEDVTEEDTGNIAYTAPDGTTFEDAMAYVAYLQLLDNRRREQALSEYEANEAAMREAATRQSAFEVLRNRFTTLGMPELAAELEKILRGEGRTRAGALIPIPTSQDGFYFALQETQAYWDRFGSTNAGRVDAGLPALSEGAILGIEAEYIKMMKNYNMPAGFYDKSSDFKEFIKNDLSALELADRLQAARQFAATVDPAIKEQLKSYYNIDENVLAAYVADPAKGQKLVTTLAGKNLSAAAAILSGLTAAASDVAMAYGAGEMRFLEQQQRFGQAATIAERGSFLSEITRGTDPFGYKEAVEITFGGLESSRRAAEKLANTEQARFRGRAGTTTSSLATPTAGQI